MPFRLRSKGGRLVPRKRRRVTTWREYDALLCNRGSVTVWLTPEAIAGRKAQARITPGGQRHYSYLALETAPALRAVFRLAPRQGEGLIGPIMKAPFSPKIRQLVHPCAAAQTRPLLRRNYSEFRFGRRPARDVHGGNPRGKLDALFSLREGAGVK